MMAGIDFADGDAVIIMDADLQHPPEKISEMIKFWRAGYDDICGKRVDRAGEAFYAFAGAAESFFEGEFAESDAELYEEATLDAKARFYEWMAKGAPTLSFSLSGLRIAYRWADGAMRYVVCVVPRRNVKTPQATSVAPKKRGKASAFPRFDYLRLI